MNEKRLSKALSGYLRHWANDEGLPIDSDGWVPISELIEAIDGNVSRADIEQIVSNDEKGRYEISDNKVRAVYGHSIEDVVITDGNRENIPDTLYHGTISKNVESILIEGIQPMNRNTVQLSDSIETAEIVASRHGRDTIVLRVAADRMLSDGRDIADRSGTYVTKEVPPQYVQKL
jgi:putative RNA 2'-phosphotransferase